MKDVEWRAGGLPAGGIQALAPEAQKSVAVGDEVPEMPSESAARLVVPELATGDGIQSTGMALDDGTGAG